MQILLLAGLTAALAGFGLVLMHRLDRFLSSGAFRPFEQPDPPQSQAQDAPAQAHHHSCGEKELKKQP